MRVQSSGRDRRGTPIVGCAVVSPGCTNCYAMRLAARLARMGQERYAGLTKPTKAGPVWTGETRLVESALTLPLRTRKPTAWFVNSMVDPFAESVPNTWIDRVFAVMALCPQHTFQVLTKRSTRVRAYLSDPSFGLRVGAELMQAARGHFGAEARVISLTHRLTVERQPLPNVWLGVSAEDQRWADERVPALLATPAAVRFVSAEPLLGAIDFMYLKQPDGTWVDALRGHVNATIEQRAERSRPWLTEHQVGLDWIIVGGESGPNARPMHPDWARQIRDACAAAGVAYFFKQHGAWTAMLDRDRENPDWRADYRGWLSDERPGIAWLNREGGRGFHGERFHVMRRVGKAVAGRLLDGVEHNEMPEASRGGSACRRECQGTGPGEARQQLRPSASPAPASVDRGAE